jgi:hypothetical protein
MPPAEAEVTAEAPAAPEPGRPGRGLPERSDLGGVVQLVTAIGSPIALGTALLFYFGWRRSQAQAAALGFDVSVLGMTPQDFMLRSIPVLFFPVALLLVAALGVVWVHSRLMDWIEQGQRSGGVLGIARVLQWSWATLPILGVALVAVARPLGELFLPLFVTLGVLGGVYGAALRRWAAREPARPSLPVAVLVAALVSVLLFWQTERLASVVGEALAEQIGADVRSLTAVTVYSPRRLQLGPEIDETRFPESDSAYRYRYRGLRLLDHAGGKYFLIPDGWTQERARLIVVRDDAATRVEFTR